MLLNISAREGLSTPINFSLNISPYATLQELTEVVAAKCSWPSTANFFIVSRGRVLRESSDSIEASGLKEGQKIVVLQRAPEPERGCCVGTLTFVKESKLTSDQLQQKILVSLRELFDSMGHNSAAMLSQSQLQILWETPEEQLLSEYARNAKSPKDMAKLASVCTRISRERCATASACKNSGLPEIPQIITATTSQGVISVQPVSNISYHVKF